MRRLLFKRLGYRPNADVSHDLSVKYPENLKICDGVKIGPGCAIGCHSEVVLHEDVTLSFGVVIETAALNFRSDKREHRSKPIEIHRSAWIGLRAIVLGGVSIGKNSVVGAGEVVRESIPDNSIFVNGEVRALERM